MTHPPAPLRPVSDEHRHEPADYEVDGRKPKRKRKALRAHLEKHHAKD